MATLLTGLDYSQLVDALNNAPAILEPASTWIESETQKALGDRFSDLVEQYLRIGSR